MKPQETPKPYRFQKILLPILSIERATLNALTKAKRTEDGAIGKVTKKGNVPDKQVAYGIDPIELREVAEILPNVPGITDEQIDVVCAIAHRRRRAARLRQAHLPPCRRGEPRFDRGAPPPRTGRPRGPHRCPHHGARFTTSIQPFASMPTL